MLSQRGSSALSEGAGSAQCLNTGDEAGDPIQNNVIGEVGLPKVCVIVSCTGIFGQLKESEHRYLISWNLLVEFVIIVGLMSPLVGMWESRRQGYVG
jgi:hypothetical protein